MKRIAFVVAVLSLFVAPSVYAQEEQVQQNAENMVSEAENGVALLESIIQDGQQKLAEARAADDVQRIDCLNSRLVNAKGFLSVVQNGEANLKDAVSRNDVEAQQHHYKLVQLAVSKGNEVAARMNECVTGVVGLTGTTVQETVRSCKVEPCLAGEQYYEPSKTAEGGGRMTSSEESENDLDVDASAFL